MVPKISLPPLQESATGLNSDTLYNIS